VITGPTVALGLAGTVVAGPTAADGTADPVTDGTDVPVAGGSGVGWGDPSVDGGTRDGAVVVVGVLEHAPKARAAQTPSVANRTSSRRWRSVRIGTLRLGATARRANRGLATADAGRPASDSPLPG
jgi:hypothetical protein